MNQESQILSDMHDKFHFIMKEMDKKISEGEQKIIEYILSQLLKRQSTIEDYKELCIFEREGGLSDPILFREYYVAFHNMKLGTMRTMYHKNRVRCMFTPMPKEDYLELAVVDGKCTF